MARNTKRRPNYSKRRRKTKPSQPETPERGLSSPPVEPPPIHIDKRELREAAELRAKNRPIRERIAALLFRREPNKDYKELIINTEALERRVATMENGILQGFEVERLDERRADRDVQSYDSRGRKPRRPQDECERGGQSALHDEHSPHSRGPQCRRRRRSARHL